MKSHIRVLCIGVVFVLTAGSASTGSAGQGGDTSELKNIAARKAKAVATPVKGAVEEKQAAQLLTGSRIPTRARRVGRTAETPYPIYIIDRKEIEQSGAASVAEVLRRCPAVR